MIWGHKINNKKHKKAIGRINRIACTAATSIERTTPQSSFELMTHIHPLDLHIKEIALKSYIRPKAQLDKPWVPKNSFGTPHLMHWERHIESMDFKPTTLLSLIHISSPRD